MAGVGGYVLYIIYCGLRENLQENPRFDGKNPWFPVRIFPTKPLWRGGLHRWQLLLQRRWHHADAASLGSEGVGELGVTFGPWPEGI